MQESNMRSTYPNVATGVKVISRRFAEAFYFPDLRLVFELWNDKSEFTKWEERKNYHLAKMIEFEKYDFKFCISDHVEYRKLPDPDDLAWFNQNIFHHKLCKERLEILVNILPQDALTALGLELAGEGFELPFTMKYAGSLEDALELLGIKATTLKFC